MQFLIPKYRFNDVRNWCLLNFKASLLFVVELVSTPQVVYSNIKKGGALNWLTWCILILTRPLNRVTPKSLNLYFQNNYRLFLLSNIFLFLFQKQISIYV